MKYNYRVTRRVHASTYDNMAEQFKIYLNSLPRDEIDETKNDFTANGNGLLSVRQMGSATKLFDSFAMFYYINGRLKELFAKFFRTGSNVLVSSPFLAALLLFFCRKRNASKKFSHRLYKNLTMEVLSCDNSENLQFVALTDLYVEIGVRLENSTFANHERARLGMKKQAEEIRTKYDFFDDKDDKKNAKIKKVSDTEMDETETIPYASPKRKM